MRSLLPRAKYVTGCGSDITGASIVRIFGAMVTIRSYLIGKSITEVAMIGIIRKIQKYFADQVDKQIQSGAIRITKDGVVHRKVFNTASACVTNSAIPNEIPSEAFVVPAIGRAYGIESHFHH